MSLTSKDYLKQIAESKVICPLTNEVKDNALLFPIGFKNIFQDLDRLEELQKENQELRKIKEKAICEMQKARKKMDFYAQSEQYKEMYAYFNGVYKGLQEVLECQKD